MLNLSVSQTILAATLKKGAELGLKPLAVIVLDAGGIPIVYARQDGASNLRFEIARGKAFGALGLGLGLCSVLESVSSPDPGKVRIKSVLALPAIHFSCPTTRASIKARTDRTRSRSRSQSIRDAGTRRPP